MAKKRSRMFDITLDKIFKEFIDLESSPLWNPVDILYQELKDDPKYTMHFKSLEKKGIDGLEEKIKAVDVDAKKFLEKLKKYKKKKGQDGPDEDKDFRNLTNKRTLLLGPHHGIVFEIDGRSKVLRSLQSPTGDIHYLTHAFKHENNLYIGSALDKSEVTGEISLLDKCTAYIEPIRINNRKN